MNQLTFTERKDLVEKIFENQLKCMPVLENIEISTLHLKDLLATVINYS